MATTRGERTLEACGSQSIVLYRDLGFADKYRVVQCMHCTALHENTKRKREFVDCHVGDLIHDAVSMDESFGSESRTL